MSEMWSEDDSVIGGVVVVAEKGRNVEATRHGRERTTTTTMV